MSDEELMLWLLLFASEDYFEKFATAPYVKTVKAACKRLGIPYHRSAIAFHTDITARIAELSAAKKQEGGAS